MESRTPHPAPPRRLVHHPPSRGELPPTGKSQRRTRQHERASGMRRGAFDHPPLWHDTSEEGGEGGVEEVCGGLGEAWGKGGRDIQRVRGLAMVKGKGRSTVSYTRSLYAVRNPSLYLSLAYTAADAPPRCGTDKGQGNKQTLMQADFCSPKKPPTSHLLPPLPPHCSKPPSQPFTTPRKQKPPARPTRPTPTRPSCPLQVRAEPPPQSCSRSPHPRRCRTGALGSHTSRSA